MLRTAMDNRGDYSTLEVAPEQPGLIAVPNDHHQAGLEAYPQQDLEYYNRDAHKSASASPVYPENKAYNAPTPVHGGVAGGNGGDAGHPAAAAPAESRIWGLKRKTFFIVLAVALVVMIGAVVGGAVGGTVGKNKTSAAAADSTTTTPPPPADSNTNGTSTTNPDSMIHELSQMHALNWTDINSTTYYGVFWQDRYTNIIMSLYTDDTKQWSTVNLTDNMVAASVPVHPKPGTPIAAAIRSWPYTVSPFGLQFTIAVFFVNTDNVIMELMTNNQRGDSWSLGDLTVDEINLAVGNNSSLAAHWDLCASNCTNDIFLWYETTGQVLKMANQMNRWQTKTNVMPNLVSGSGLSTAVMAASGGTTSLGNQALALRVYYDVSGIIQEAGLTPPGKSWLQTQAIASDLPSEPPLLASTAFVNASLPAKGPISIVHTQCYDNGTVRANYWNNFQWHGQADPIMQGDKVFGNFTAIGVNEALRWFGITNNSEIHQFQINRANPLSWTYVDQVTGTNVTSSRAA